QFNAEQRFERTFAANPAPALICRLSDLRYVKVNQGFLDMTGLTRETVLGKSAYELDVLDGGDDKEDAVAKLNAGLTISQREGVVRLADGGARFVIVAGNAYLGDKLEPRLAKRSMPCGTQVVTTEPLAPEIAQALIPQNYC
uniref:FAD-dependent oxidoreductase n=1 Tax=Escherichia coli TaxID=562 RepID=UPI001967752D